MFSSKVIPGVSLATADQYNFLRQDAMGASYLLTHAKSTPDNTFRVEAGFWYNNNTRIDVAEYNSSAISAPVADVRVDLISVNTSGTVIKTEGVEGGGVPAIPTGNFVLAEIWCRVGGTVIKDEDDTINHYIVDRRQILNFGGSYVDPLTTDGDILVRDGGVNTRLPVGTEGQVLGVSSGFPAYIDAVSGSGYTAYDVVSSTLTGTTPVVITDARITTDTPFNIYFASQPVGSITKTLGAGTLTVSSNNAADTMTFKVVLFGFGNKTTYVQSTTQTLNGAGPRTIVDSRISADTPVNLFPMTVPSGFLTIEAQAGQVYITSSATESSLQVRYIGFTEVPSPATTGFVFTSAAQDLPSATPATITHNLGVTQADVEAGRYTVYMSSKFDNGGSVFSGTYGFGAPASGQHAAFVRSLRSSSNPMYNYEMMWQANTIKFTPAVSSGSVLSLRIYIQKNY